MPQFLRVVLLFLAEWVGYLHDVLVDDARDRDQETPLAPEGGSVTASGASSTPANMGTVLRPVQLTNNDLPQLLERLVSVALKDLVHNLLLVVAEWFVPSHVND